MTSIGPCQKVPALPVPAALRRPATEFNRRDAFQSISTRNNRRPPCGGLFLFLHDFSPAQFWEPVFQGARGRDVFVRALVPGVLTTPHL